MDTLDTLITKTFRNVTLKNHREFILFEREKSLLPATQSEAQRIKTIRSIHEKIAELIAKKREIDEEIATNHHQIRVLESGDAGASTMKDRRIFTINCPRDECRGFVHNSTWECGTCNHFVCSKCHEYIGDTNEVEHTCKEENIQTATLIKKDSKPCPGCATLIFKISGCNQMWCTQCHTTFSWATGAVITGTIHNPHFYEWAQKNKTTTPQRNLGDVPCGGLIGIYELRKMLNYALQNCDVGKLLKNDSKYTNDTKTVYTIHRVALDIEHTVMPQYRRPNNIVDNIQLRVKYLMNELTEEDFKKTLQQREKRNMKHTEIYAVLEMYLFTVIDIFNNLLHYYQHKSTFGIADVIILINEIVQLQEFANSQMTKISKRYSCIVPYIHIEDVRTHRA